MMKAFALFAGVSLAKVEFKNRLHSEEQYWTLWQNFLGMHDLGAAKYPTEQEHGRRFEIFRDNMDKMKTHNDEYEVGKHTWFMGVTHFADLTESEFEDYINMSGDMEKDSKATETFDASKYGDNPTAKDWRSLGAVTPVKDQGSCGSCWAFSTTGSLEGQNFLTGTKKLTSLSEQELVDCAGAEGNQGCEGGLMDYAFEYVEKDGLCTESDYGYVGTKKESCKASTCTRVGFSVKSYTDIKKGAEDDLETAVANIGPISIAVDANSKWQMYSGGVMKAPIFKKDSLDHGVLAVGYDNEGDKGVAYWIIKNSWNENWGEKGYLRLEKGKNAYGLSDSASYPVLG